MVAPGVEIVQINHQNVVSRGVWFSFYQCLVHWMFTRAGHVCDGVFMLCAGGVGDE